MTAAESKNSLARHAAPFGAIVEEDTGLRGMRVFQVVAPYGTVWSDGVKNIRCDVDSSREKQSQTYNRREVAYARGRIERGVQPMTAQERLEFDEEGGEGLMARKPGLVWCPGRTVDLLKIK